MQCPHCHSEIEVKPHTFALGEDQDGSWHISTWRCKVCDRLVADLCTSEDVSFPVRPVSSDRPRLTADVPPEFESEFHIACQVLAYSPESSAAISRRLLRRFLAAHTGAGQVELAEQIRVTADSAEVQPFLREALLTLAYSAKIAPQSEKSLHPEALIAVEPGEAEWILDVLQTLFEVYFVQPARLQRMRDSLEERVGPLTASVAPERSDEDQSAGVAAEATAVDPETAADTSSAADTQSSPATALEGGGESPSSSEVESSAPPAPTLR